MRIEGVNAYQWVFRCKTAVVHKAAFTRAAAVVRETMDGARPKVWMSDRYSAQQNHAEAQQTCLAHLARDVAYGMEASEDDVVLRLKLWFDAVFAFAKRITDFAQSTMRSKRRTLERQIDDVLQTSTKCPVARELLAKIARARDQLLTFCDFPGEVEPTNNGCERALRPAVIQRKVTNGFRAKWAADRDAAVRTTLDTARLGGGEPSRPFSRRSRSDAKTTSGAARQIAKVTSPLGNYRLTGALFSRNMIYGELRKIAIGILAQPHRRKVFSGSRRRLATFSSPAIWAHGLPCATNWKSTSDRLVCVFWLWHAVAGVSPSTIASMTAFDTSLFDGTTCRGAARANSAVPMCSGNFGVLRGPSRSKTSCANGGIHTCRIRTSSLQILRV